MKEKLILKGLEIDFDREADGFKDAFGFEVNLREKVLKFCNGANTNYELVANLIRSGNTGTLVALSAIALNKTVLNVLKETKSP